ncbi:hypothetical protein [Bradyrhizobium sp. sGM-13]|uniref:hypothetical protein n=1 Tax=Bradyrhizobium sp. sGM-13 TaxID=2831781 RepID=UPI001BCE88E9|nr:hypothetical protein [Bradyrhizobium sp. sGM-13]
MSIFGATQFAVCLSSFLALATAAHAQDSLLAQIRAWDTIPEQPSLKMMCSNSLRYPTTLADLRKRNATVVAMMRWGQQEAERTAAELPSETLLPVGTQLGILTLIRRIHFDAPIYEQIPGGFPQWTYRSCLKGKPLN